MEDLRARLRAVPTLTGAPPAFDPDSAPDEPHDLFVEWLLHAIDIGVPEACAMTLSTVGPQGRPSARVLILKNVDRDGWQFASTSTSRKGHELARNPQAALTFYWIPLGRQVRITGAATPAAPDASARDFHTRPAAARAEALVGRQSQPLDDPSAIDAETAKAAERIEQDPEVTAPNWTLYTLRADEVEFWQADPDRRHLRLAYSRTADGWNRRRLWP